MPGIIMTTVIFAIMSMLTYSTYIPIGIKSDAVTKSVQKRPVGFYIILILGVAVRYIGAYFNYGHPTDMNCFSSWAARMADVGAGGFYSPDVFTDYPPGYMYILWIIGKLRQFIPMENTAFGMLLKTPAIICDALTALVIYKLSKEKLDGCASAVMAFFVLINPAIYINSALWGQVDSIFTLLVLVCIYLASEKRLILSFYVFSVAIIVKPQALFYTPILLFAIAEETVYPAFDAKKLAKYITWGMGAVAFALLLSAPFGIDKVINQYIGTLSSYQYQSVNAFNMWSMLGGNWEKLTPFVSFVSNLAIILTVLGTMRLFFRVEGKDKYYYCAAVICVSVFVFAAKMHERYCYPAVVFLLAAVALKPKLLTFGLYTAVSALQFFNTAAVLWLFDDAMTKFHDKVEVIGGAATVAVFAFLVYTSSRLAVKKPVKNKSVIGIIEAPGKADYKINKKDFALVAALTAVYACIAFYNLGDMKAPENAGFIDGNGESAELSEVCDIKKIKLYPGSYDIAEDNALLLSFYGADGTLTDTYKVDNASVFCWYIKDVDFSGVKRISITASGMAELMEAAFETADGTLAKVITDSPIFDEQQLVPERYSFRNSTYFDEIYHARTAYEFIEKRNIYEWTHPPLGKSIISVGIRLFGMNPFGWRFMGTLFGVLMVPVMYIFAKKLFGKTSLALFSVVLYTFDFMHFAQTRISTIDVYITFFIMLMYVFMLMYLRCNIYDTPIKKQLVPLALCGVSMGLGIACKWTGVYAGAGLGVLFFAKLITAYFKENDKAEFWSYTSKVIPLCMLFFVLVPTVIYALSYIPFIESNGGGFAGVIKNQADMFSYHSKLDATHSFSSPWYGWPVMSRPIWYYSAEVSEGVKEGISSFGNPAVWWLGIPAFFYVLYIAVCKRDKTARFLSVSYLAQLLAWVPITRCTFIYHYFPSVPFVVLMVGYAVGRLPVRDRKKTYFMIGIGAVCVVLFAMFYPVLAGKAVSVEYVEKFLRWFSSWQLI